MIPDTYVAVAEALADVAAAVIRPLFRTVPPATDKDDASPVTIADRAAEQAMRGVLRERLPGHGILGEEFGAENAGSDWTWVLDPIDGTRAFITGRPIFGTLIGLLHEGRPVLGIIDQPMTGERWVGAAGRATTFRGPFGGTPRTRPCPALALAELSCTSPEMFGPEDAQGFARLRRAVRRVTWGGDCYAYGLVALGQVDVIAEATMKLWDWAALAPVVEGAGGRMTDWSGNPLGAESDGRVIAVGDPALLAPALKLLAGP